MPYDVILVVMMMILCGVREKKRPQEGICHIVIFRLCSCLLLNMFMILAVDQG